MDITRTVATFLITLVFAIGGPVFFDLTSLPLWVLIAWVAIVAIVAARVSVWLDVRAYRRMADRADARYDRAMAMAEADRSDTAGV